MQIDWIMKWTKQYKKAQKILKPWAFERFMFFVGTSGTDEERTKKAKIFFKILEKG